jgi:hypothetical protein
MSDSALISQPAGSWKPGQSGNPNGRVKDRIDVTEMCRRIGPRAVHVIDALMDDADPRVRLQAAMAILDRGFGKPVQALLSNDNASSLTLMHLVAVLALNEQPEQHATINGSATDNTDVSTPPDLMAPAIE